MVKCKFRSLLGKQSRNPTSTDIKLPLGFDGNLGNNSNTQIVGPSNLIVDKVVWFGLL